MSHLTLLDTQLQSFQYLQKSLQRISQKSNISEKSGDFELKHSNFLQGKFAKQVWGNLSVLLNWTPTGYNLIVDEDVFAKNSNVNVLLDNITQNYAIEAIVGESTAIGFEPLSYKQNFDGSKTIVLERIYKHVNKEYRDEKKK